jgi:hypothetical protein
VIGGERGVMLVELRKEALFAAAAAWLDPARKNATGNERMHDVIEAVLGVVVPLVEADTRERIKRAIEAEPLIRGAFSYPGAVDAVSRYRSAVLAVIADE